MMALPPDARQKLSKLLGMTGSVHDGEALNAARMANELLKRHGATWADAVLMTVSADDPEPLEHSRRALWTLENGTGVLKSKERQFLSNVMARRTITAKQREWLDALQSRVEGWLDA